MEERKSYQSIEDGVASDGSSEKEHMDQFGQAYENYKARIDTIQARSVAAELFELL